MDHSFILVPELGNERDLFLEELAQRVSECWLWTRLPGFESWVFPFLVVKAWVSHLAFLVPGCLVYKMAIIITFTSFSCKN